jgi:hypothetical protein
MGGVEKGSLRWRLKLSGGNTWIYRAAIVMDNFVRGTSFLLRCSGHVDLEEQREEHSFEALGGEMCKAWRCGVDRTKLVAPLAERGARLGIQCIV